MSLDDLHDVIANSPGRSTRALAHDHAHAPTRSVFEDAFFAFLDRHDLPRPEVNQRVAGYEVDMLWRSQRRVAELDGTPITATSSTTASATPSCSPPASGSYA